MSNLFQFNKSYQLIDGQWIESQIPEKAIKYSLVSSATLVEQVPAIVALVNGINQVFVRVLQGKYGDCWELFVAQNEHFLLRNRLSESSFDFLKWPDSTAKAPALLLFDMDSTFIEIEVIDQLAIHHNVGDKVAEVTEKAMQGELDFAESLIERVACLKGLESKAIAQIKQSLPLSQGVEELVAAAHKAGTKVAIVSGGFTPFVNHLKEKLNLYSVKANHLRIEDERLTGEVEGSIVDAQAKQDFLKQLSDELGIGVDQTMAIGDGANDLLMMNAAGFDLAYRAKPKVQSAANGRFNDQDFKRLIDIFHW